MAGTATDRRALSQRLGILVAGVLAVAALMPSGGAARAQAPPKATGEPTILGRAIVGSVLTASNGSWSGTGPFNYTYRWLRCPASGGGGNGQGCTLISGATFKRYAARPADVGHRLRVRVSAANSEGSATATSNATAIVRAAPARPANTEAPSISGTAQVGQTLTADNGTWTGQSPISFTYQWRRCDQSGRNCSDISGATGKTYVLTSADQGARLRVRVTARNSAGAASATSAPTGVVAKAEAPGGATVAIGDVSLPNRLIIDQYSFQPNRLRRHGRVVARFHVSDSRNHSVTGALVFVEGIPLGQTTRPPEQATGADGYVTVTVRATSRLQLRGANRYVFFVRARKSGENPLGGVTARRLVAVRLG
jgi:hypothetical protein